MPLKQLEKPNFRNRRIDATGTETRTLHTVGAGGVQPNISKEQIINTSFPLSPLPEPERIVERMDELLPLCEKQK